MTASLAVAPDPAVLRRKALSILREGRLTVLNAVNDPDTLAVFAVTARVEGHRGTYAVDLVDGEWVCTCRDGERPCGHIAAAQLVTGHAT